MSDRQYLRVTWIFHIVGTDEVAMTSLNLSSIEFEGWTGAAAALAEINIAPTGTALLNRMNTLMSNGNLAWAAYSTLDSVRIAAVGQDGLEIGDAKEQDDATVRAGGNNGTLPQASVVLSLRSTFTTGRANYGRMYLPHAEMPLLAGNPTASTTVTAAICAAADLFIEGVVSDVNQDTAVTVDAFIITHEAGFASKPVLEVKVGSVNDTQRRRRNRLIEQYSTAVVAPYSGP